MSEVKRGARPPAGRVRRGARPRRAAARDEAGGGRSGGELRGRVLASIPALALALFLVIEGGPIFMAGLFVLGCVCLHELCTMYGRTEPVRLACYAGLAGLLLAAQYGGRAELPLAAVAAVPVVFGLGMLQRRPSAAGMMVSLFGLWWVGFGFAHAVLLRGLPHGLGVVIDVLVGTFVGDTGAYFGGRLFGKRPLAPSISPNKTVEGLAIGMLFAVVGVWLAGLYEPWMPASHSLVLGLGVAIAGPVGDLFESFVKRQAGTKDAGRVFGAHGGALDRLDAVLFTAVVGYYIWAAYV